MDGCCHPVHHTLPALPVHLPAPRPAEDSGSEDEEEGDDGVQRRRNNSSDGSSESDSSETECSDLY